MSSMMTMTSHQQVEDDSGDKKDADYRLQMLETDLCSYMQTKHTSGGIGPIKPTNFPFTFNSSFIALHVLLFYELFPSK